MEEVGFTLRLKAREKASHTKGPLGGRMFQARGMGKGTKVGVQPL